VLSGGVLALFKPCDWSTRFMKVILLVLSWVRILYLLRPGWRQDSCVQCVQSSSVLLYKTSVQPFNCSKESVYTPRLDENTVAGLIWPGSKNVRKEGAIIFLISRGPYFLTCFDKSQNEGARAFP
jgi:hypothetical protein